MDKEKILNSLNFRNFYTQYIPSLKVNGKAESMGLCPFHDDHNPSLSVNLESGLYNCLAGCGGGDVFRFYEKLKGVDFPTALKELAEMQGIADTPKGKVVATFEYKNIEGKTVYKKERIEPGRNGRSKEFPFKHLEGDKWVTGRGCEPVPYNLPQLVKSTYTFIVEGEAKADLLTKDFKLTATCLDSGAQSPFRDEYLKFFEGKEKIIILLDNDIPGRAYAERIAIALYGKVGAIKIVELPGLQEAEDIIDWVNNRDSKETEAIKAELGDIIKATPEWKKTDIEEGIGDGVIEIIRLDSVIAEKVSWLWNGYVPLGKITLLDGDPGLGKSLFTLDMTARISTGQAMPDGSPSIQGGIVLMSLEDGLADTIAPRLEIAGADKSKIVALQGVKGSDGKYRFPTVEDTEAIKKACKKIDAKLVVIDPLMGYMGKANSWRDQDVRTALSPLAKMAEDIGVAVIIVRHLNKTSSSNSVYRGGGSIGIIGAARSALLIAKDPEDENRRILAGIKSNLAPLPPSLSYTIENIDGVPKIAWGGVTNHTADALLAIPSSLEDRSALEDATDFLRDILTDGEVEAKEVLREAKAAGIAERTLHRAKKVLGVIIRKEGYQGKWTWTLKGCQESPKAANKNNGNLWGSLAAFGNSAPLGDDPVKGVLDVFGGKIVE